MMTPLPPLPATNTLPSDTLDSIEDGINGAGTVIELIDLETCQEALATQSELESLQEQGQDVAELATAVAELIEELENCETFLTPTPLNE